MNNPPQHHLDGIFNGFNEVKNLRRTPVVQFFRGLFELWQPDASHHKLTNGDIG